MNTAPINVQWERMKRTHRDEFHGPCPVCGGTDRFIVWKDRGNYWCRQCSAKGFLDGNAHQPSVDEVAALELRIQQRQEQDRLLQLEAVKHIESAAYWRGFHDAMDLQHRQYWLNEGIPDWAVDYFNLGYCPSKRISHNGDTYTYPAYTIPIIEPVSHKPVNVQYRLVNAPPDVGKYRQEANVPAAPFFFDTDRAEGDSVLMVEGSKKAIVVGCALDDPHMQFIGIPSNTPSEAVIRTVANYRTVYVALDPGAERQAQRIAGIVGKAARIVSLPVKPDDLLVQYGGAASDLRRAMHEAVRV